MAAFGPDQLYIVFVVADGGTDLECFDVRSAAEARSILLQARNPLSFHANGWQMPQDCIWRSVTFRPEEAMQRALNTRQSCGERS